VPEYDAFGREIGEDPLAALREATNPAPPKTERTRPEPGSEPETAWPDPETASPEVVWPDPATAEPEPAPSEPAATAAEAPEHVAAPRIEFVRPRRRRRGGLAGLLVTAAVVGGIVLAMNSVVEEGQDLIDRIQPEIAEPEAAPTGLQAGSMIRRDNYAKALNQLADSDLGRPMTIRVAPERIDATLLKDGQIHIVQITAAGELREFGTNPGNGPAMAYKALDPAAPEKIVRRGATRRFPASSISYVLVTPSDQMAVNAYFEGGRVVFGDRHGRVQRVL
jgi:hypothetical protein